MPEHIVIHKATGVLKRATSDVPTSLAPDEEAVAFPNIRGFNLAGSSTGWYAWDKGGTEIANLREATSQEINNADVDPARVAIKRAALRQNLADAIVVARVDVLVPDSIKAFLGALAAYLRGI